MYRLIKLITIIYLLSTIKIFGLENEKSVTFYSKYGDFKITLPHFQDSIDYIKEDYYTAHRGYWQQTDEFEPGDENTEIYEDFDGITVNFKRFKIHPHAYWLHANFSDKLKKMSDSLVNRGKRGKISRDSNKRFIQNYIKGDEETVGKKGFEFWKSNFPGTDWPVYYGVVRMPNSKIDEPSTIFYEVLILDSNSKISDRKVKEIINSITSPQFEEKDADYYWGVAKNWLLRFGGKKEHRLRTEYLEKAIEFDSTNFLYYTELAESYQRLGNITLNFKNLKKAIKFNPKNGRLVRKLGRSHYLISSPVDSVMKYLDKAYDLDPNSFIHPNTKFDYLISYGLFDEAKELAIEQEKRFKNGGSYSNFLDSLGSYAAGTESTYYADVLEWIDRADFFIKQTSKIKNFKQDDYFRKNRNFYPYVTLTPLDTINYPIKVGIDFELIDIKNFKEIKNENNVDVTFRFISSSNYPPVYHTKKLEVLEILEDSVGIADISDRLIIDTDKSEIKSDSSYYDVLKNRYNYLIRKSTHQFGHNFKLRDFPFDTQKIKIRVTIDEDSTVYAFDRNKLTSKMGTLVGLQDGYNVEKIYFDLGYEKNYKVESFKPGEDRNIVNPYADVVIEIKRSGSLLFIKLFLGTFLAVLMSLSTFYINKRNFGSRIDVSVGALFICVGNKYFVESVTPIAQVLTKADVINNISLILIIANVLLVIGQHKPEIKLGKFEDSKYALKFSSISFLVVLFLTIIV